MAQGMDDVDEARTSRQLDSVLETVGMDCNPGYGRGTQMRSLNDRRVFRHSFFCRADSLRASRGTTAGAPSRRTDRRANVKS